MIAADNELTASEYEHLVQRTLVVLHHLFKEFPELRIFPQECLRCLGNAWTLYLCGGMSDDAILDHFLTPVGAISLAGMTYARMVGYQVGADAGAIAEGARLTAGVGL